MSRPNTRGLRDMNQPTLADIRGAADAAQRYCEYAEACADDAAEQHRQAEVIIYRTIWIVVGVAVAEALIVAAQAVILVAR